jgi:hypothetical protein
MDPLNAEQNTVFNEVFKAYADCHADDYAKGVQTRNLSFRASQALSPIAAHDIMLMSCPHGYNKFEASILKKLPDDCKVVLARESSVCIYVQKGEKEIPDCETLKADEYNVLERATFGTKYHQNNGGYAGELRIWWD